MCPQEATEIEWVGRKLSRMHFQIHTNSASSISELLSNSCGNILLMSPDSQLQHRKTSPCLEASNSWMHLCLSQYFWCSSMVQECNVQRPLPRLDSLAVILFLSLPVRWAVKHRRAQNEMLGSTGKAEGASYKPVLTAEKQDTTTTLKCATRHQVNNLGFIRFNAGTVLAGLRRIAKNRGDGCVADFSS